MSPWRRQRVRVGLVASEPLRVEGLIALLEDDLAITPTVIDDPVRADLSAMDLVLLDAGSTDLLVELLSIYRLKYSQLKLMVLGAETSFSAIERVIGAGAKGYLSYTASANEVRMAMDVVLDGSIWAPRKVLARLLETRAGGPNGTSAHPPRVTPREQQVLGLLASGRPNREIAILLGIDETTVKAHVSRLMRKFGVGNRVGLTLHEQARKLLMNQ
ncbi:MAG: response regulator transcription factor [Acidobacteriota bacterium]|nr:response regulator transcription factor [Acidobacteriota bacterium]